MLEYSSVALLPKDPGVNVALDDRVNLVRGVREARLLKQRILLRVDERVRRAVKHVMAEKTKRKRPANALVLDGQVTHRGANVTKRPGDVACVHVVCEVTAGRGPRRNGAEAYKEWVRTLVAQKEGEKLFLTVDKAFGKTLCGVFAKDVVRYQRGHGRTPRVHKAGPQGTALEQTKSSL